MLAAWTGHDDIISTILDTRCQVEKRWVDPGWITSEFWNTQAMVCGGLWIPDQWGILATVLHLSTGTMCSRAQAWRLWRRLWIKAREWLLTVYKLHMTARYHWHWVCVSYLKCWVKIHTLVTSQMSCKLLTTLGLSSQSCCFYLGYIYLMHEMYIFVIHTGMYWFQFISLPHATRAFNLINFTFDLCLCSLAQNLPLHVLGLVTCVQFRTSKFKSCNARTMKCRWHKPSG